MVPVTFVECTRIIQLHMGGREETPSHDRRSFSHLLWFPPPRPAMDSIWTDRIRDWMTRPAVPEPPREELAWRVM